WDLDKDSDEPAVELRGGHTKGGITCVAFSPDGKWCVTGGEQDRAICLWNTDNGELLRKLAGSQRNGSPGSQAIASHRGPITSLQFLSATQLVSASKDNTLIIWKLSANDGSPQRTDVLERRSGEVPVLGVSPADQRILFDHDKEL